MTGDGRLYEATTQVLDRSQTCEGAIAEMTQQFGAPDIDQRPSYAHWRDRRRSGSPYARSRVAPNWRSGQSR
jgi:hypothetical protein